MLCEVKGIEQCCCSQDNGKLVSFGPFLNMVNSWSSSGCDTQLMEAFQETLSAPISVCINSLSHKTVKSEHTEITHTHF